MTRSDWLAYVRQRPFRPFRLVLTEGAVHEVRRPDLVMVGLDSLILGKPADRHPGLCDHCEIVTLSQVVKVLPLEAAAPAPGNGAGS